MKSGVLRHFFFVFFTNGFLKQLSFAQNIWLNTYEGSLDKKMKFFIFCFLILILIKNDDEKRFSKQLKIIHK
jgi:hypothetical protein